MVTLAIILLVALALVGGVLVFMQQKQFGKDPYGARLELVMKSPNYRNGAFQNAMPTDMMLKDTSYLKLTWDSFNKPSEVRPPRPLPSTKTDLKKLGDDKPVIIWFGHSSYLIKSKGFNILVDPVLNGHASPVSFFGKPFAGSDVYSIADMPRIDMVLLTHDHYDHLHYESIAQLAGSATFFCTSLGVGSHVGVWRRKKLRSSIGGKRKTLAVLR